jgi:hypothetical protein
MPVTQIETTPVWANFLDLANDVKPYLQFPASSVTSDVQLQTVVDMCCTWVQNYLGRPIAPTEFFRRFSGWSGLNGAYINLPYCPVLSMVSVVEYRGTSGPFLLTEQTPSHQVGGQEVYQMDYLRGTVIRTFMGLVQRPWFPGSRNIEITWVAGYNPVPPDIRVAALELVGHWWRNTQQASRSGPMPTGYDPENPAAGMFAAIPHRVEALLSQYSRQGLG